MRNSRIAGLAVGVAFIAATAASAQQAGSTNAKDIRQFLRVNTEFCTGGQPTLEQIAGLKAEGVKAVLNLRTPAEYRTGFHIEDEEKTVKAAGLKYFNIPVVYMSPTDANADEFLKITDDPANRPMFIHCTVAIRAGAFWLIRRVLRDHYTWDDAFAEAKKIGLVGAPHLEDFAKKYIASHQGGVSMTASGKSGEWTGKVLTGIVAIGGETTGVVLETAQGRIELQTTPAQRATLESLKGQQVTIRGQIDTRQGVEVPTRTIITVTEIVK